MDDTRDVTQNGKTNVDEQISAASSLQEDTQRREDDGKDDLADVAVESMLASRSSGIPSIAIATGRRKQRSGCSSGKYSRSGERHFDGEAVESSLPL